jgi:DNA polymerase elongation subunit (family B)
MRQFNISSETFIVRDKNYIPGPNEIKTTSGAVFSKEKGLIPSILDVYYAKRKAAKNNKKKSLQQYEDYLHIYKQRFGTDYVKYSDE